MRPASPWREAWSISHARRVEAEVVQTLAALGEKATDGVLGVERLQQLDLGVPRAEQRGAHALIGHLGLAQQRQAERALVERVRVPQPLHHDPDVMNPEHHGRILP